MKQIAQYQDGRLELQDVPLPTAPPAGLLVRVTHSVISAGTEKAKIAQARMNLIQKARARPDQVRRVVQTANTLGWKAALDKVRNRLETPTPLGYSAAGIVERVDASNTRFRAGDRVAVGGAECAFHAEFVAVPDLLAAKVPDGVQNCEAAYTAIASIAMQAVRQVQPTLGDRVLVIGQGLVGLLVTAMLRAHGARVMAMDVAASRREVAEAVGADRVVVVGVETLEDEVRTWTDGYGVDAVVLATATQSNVPTEQALDALRDRGRIIVVGNTHVELPWKIAYEKEIEVRYSRSYGAGRYDQSYEWGGTDYPIGYVRWTEQRNFESVLHLMQTGQLEVAALTTRRVKFAECLNAYNDLLDDRASAEIGVVLEYSLDSPLETRVPMGGGVQPRVASASLGERLTRPVVRVDVIGAGNFARTMLLPHLKGRITLGTVVNLTALSANHVKTKFGFAEAATDTNAVFGPAPHDPQLKAFAASEMRPRSGDAAVLIATRHHLHAPLVVQALDAGRHVFVEKPLCLTCDELKAIDNAMARSSGSAQVGFNRRFAAASIELKRVLESSPGPKTASFRVMAGRLDPAHWYANHAQSGGRVLGEACHFLDFFMFLFEALPVRVSAQTVTPARGRLPFPDTVTAQVEFADGSSGQLVYSGEGDPSWPKEVCTVFAAGVVAELENFRKLTIHRNGRRSIKRFSGKGHAEQMAEWTAFLLGQTEHPFPYEQSRRSMLLTFAVVEAIQRSQTVEIAHEEFQEPAAAPVSA